MAFEDFKNDPGHFYTITEVSGVFGALEQVGHWFWITGTAAHPELKCLTEKHSWTFQNIHYECASDRLLAEINTPAETLPIAITVVVAKSHIWCTIDSLNPTEPGSWTAEDPDWGGGPG